jgi:hypothetical protein
MGSRKTFQFTTGAGVASVAAVLLLFFFVIVRFSFGLYIPQKESKTPGRNSAMLSVTEETLSACISICICFPF